MLHSASHPSINFYGRWNRGSDAISICSGSLVEFAYRGNDCALAFDTSGPDYPPSIFLQVDSGPITRISLPAEAGVIPLWPLFNTPPVGTPPFPIVASAHHLVRFWIAINSLYLSPVAGKQWTTLIGACRFRGVELSAGGELVSTPYCGNQIEFIGDSITQGLRLLFNGKDYDVPQQMPYVNWPQLVANMLGMRPIVTGFGGQGLSGSGTNGVPPVNAAFPFVYGDVPWRPVVPPKVVVIYQGTNDPIPAPEFQAKYATLLATVRGAYPAAMIFASCPHNKGNYASAIEQSVAAMRDPRIQFLNYSTGVISAPETCDGCHLNPGGAVRLATAFANDIAAKMK